MHLLAAHGALAGRPDRARALEHLLEAWRGSQRHPQLGALVEGLSREACRGLEPLDARLGDSDYHAAWIARTASAQAIELDLLTPGLMRGPLGKRIRERFDLLTPFADDPRMISCYGRMILEPPVMAASNFSLWTQIFASLRASPDIRLRSVLERRLRDPGGSSQFWPMLQQRSLDLLGRLPQELPALDAEVATTIAAIAARIEELEAGPPAQLEQLRASDRLESELLAQIYAEPEQLEHRMVWADALLGRGDPRGEFVQLQLARSGSERAATTREKRLLKRHALSWSGELGAVLERKSLVFEDGFLARGEALFNSVLERELIASEAWATLRELDCDDAQLLCQPQLRALERAGGFGLSAYMQLLEHQGPSSSLHTLGPVFLDELPLPALRRLREAEGSWLPQLDSLWLHIDGHEFGNHAEDYEWVLETPVGRRLSSLRVSGFPYMSYDSRRPSWSSWAEAFAESPRWQRLERLRFDLHLLSYEFIRESAGLRLRVWHDYAGSVNEYRRKEAKLVLEELVGVVDTLEFVGVNSKAPRADGLVLLARSLGFEQVEHSHRPGASQVGHGIWRRLHKLIARQQRAAKRRSTSERQNPAQVAQSKVRARRRRLASASAAPLTLVAAEALDETQATTHARWLRFVPTRGEIDRARGSELLCLAREVCAFESPSLAPLWSIGGARNYVAACFDGARRQLWLGSARGETVLWDVERGCALARGRFHRRPITALAHAPAHGLLLSCDRDGKLMSWEAPERGAEVSDEAGIMVPRATHYLHTPALRLALAPDGESLALLSASGEVSLRRLPELSEAVVLGHVGARASVLGWAPAGDHLVAALPHGGLVLWDPDGVELTRLELHEQAISAACWTPAGELVTAAKRVHVTGAVSGEQRLTLDPGEGKISALAVSSDGEQLAVATARGLSLWSLSEGRRLSREPEDT